MLTFKPIAYDPADYVSFKYIGSSSIREGQICYLVKSDANSSHCTQFVGVSPATIPLSIDSVGTPISSYDSGKYFPVFREDPDIDTTVATIAKNEYVISFPLRPGTEFDIHASITESGFASTWTSVGQRACLGSNGKWTPALGINSTEVTLGECVGTFNATCVRQRAK